MVRTAAAQFEDCLVRVPCHAPCNFRQPQAQLVRAIGLPLPVQAEPSEQVENVVSERGNPQAVGIRHEAAAAHVRERERILGFFEKVFHCPALAVGSNHFPHWRGEVRDDEHQ